MAENLKLCPFCGCESKVESFTEYGKVKGYFIYCNNCHVEQGKLYKTKANAIKAWNRRINV